MAALCRGNGIRCGGKADAVCSIDSQDETKCVDKAEGESCVSW